MANWIVVVDDDLSNLKVAGHILSKNNKRVTALKSGEALLTFIRDNKPDLILLDIRMPGMDGFETFRKLRSLENELQLEEIPVVFLTADEETATESKGFEIGVSDYIRKPFEPEILVKRINNILEKQEKLHHFQDEATRDKLTGFLNKAATNERLKVMCRKIEGYLMMIDLDSFKLVNDLYGHDMGDKVLITFAELLKKNLPEGSTMGRVGGDEFVAFCSAFTGENDLKILARCMNEQLVEKAKELMGPDMEIPLGVSMGAIYVSGPDADYTDALALADKALYNVKQKDKHGYAIYNGDTVDEKGNDTTGLKALSMILSERNIPDSALSLEKDAFINVYRFIMRYLKRYNRSASKLLFTLCPVNEQHNDIFYEACDNFCEHIKDHLRKSDLVMRYRKNQVFVFLTDIKEFAIAQVVGGIMNSWYKENGDGVSISYEIENIEPDLSNDFNTLWIAVVDDEPLNLKIAERILEKNGMKVSLLNSGRELLDFVKNNIPDLILLDVKMQEMDGFDTLAKLRAENSEISDIPVIFLTANDDESFEARGLSLGAMDFIRKPFIPEVLVLRVKHAVELIRLQRTLYQEVEKKTAENERLFIHVVESLAQAIDAKDSYTNGHSGRVAEYARLIAKKAGYSSAAQNNIYIMGLLHDVGKIGVPDHIINKPSRLTDEEFEVIKRHPSVGSQILSNIKEMPELASGAHWHHERFGGGGYPDGLVGDKIPETSRIIAVADAYDAMTSNRSYRKYMTQEKVRSELENGKGTQFDPRFADIMLKLMDEDPDYQMREH